MSSTASWPLQASRMAPTWGSRWRRSSRRWRAGDSSSTTKTLMFSSAGFTGFFSDHVQGEKDLDHGAAFVARPDGEAAFAVGIEPGNALAGDGQTQSLAGLDGPPGGQPCAIIEYADDELLVQGFGGDGDRASGGAVGDTVAD